MPLSDEVRGLLEFSIELLVIGGGLPSLFLQRPAWLRELRERYSFWSIVPFVREINSSVAIPVILGVILIWHIALAAGWCCISWTWASWLFYCSLGLSLLLVALLWYQVRMTSFPQVVKRVFWLGWYIFEPQTRSSSKFDPSFLESATPRIEDGWNKTVALMQYSFSRLLLRLPLRLLRLLKLPRETWPNLVRDLGRLGANTRTPRETHLVLRALGDLAQVIPLNTYGRNPPLVQWAEAIAQTLWPLDASDEEAFRRAIEAFRRIFKRWGEAEQVSRDTADKSGELAESPLLPHLYRLGRGLLEHYPDLLEEYLAILTPYDADRDNRNESHLLFRLGLRAVEREQWEDLLRVANKLREYVWCSPNNQPVDETGMPPMPTCVQQKQSHTNNGDEYDDVSLEWITDCEPTLWFIGLMAYVVEQHPYSCQWVERFLSRLYPLDNAQAVEDLKCTLQHAQRFFTTVTFHPEIVQAIHGFYTRLDNSQKTLCSDIAVIKQSPATT